MWWGNGRRILRLTWVWRCFWLDCRRHCAGSAVGLIWFLLSDWFSVLKRIYSCTGLCYTGFKRGALLWRRCDLMKADSACSRLGCLCVLQVFVYNPLTPLLPDEDSDGTSWWSVFHCCEERLLGCWCGGCSYTHAMGATGRKNNLIREM